MARPRVIERNQILDAAETVVQRDGAARLTLESVASEAGISKASVLYDYKTKHALIKAVIERRVAEDGERLQAAVARLGPTPDAPIRGRIAAAAETAPDDTHSVAIQLCSALASDVELRDAMRVRVQEELDTILSTSANRQAALTAFLAVEGLRALEFFGLVSWTPAQRAGILENIEALLDLPPPPDRPLSS